MEKKLKYVFVAAVLLFITVVCSACNEFETVNTKISVNCINKGTEQCYIWFTGEEKSAEKLTLPNGSRSRNIILSYVVSNAEGADNSALIQEEKLYVYIYKADGNELKHELKVMYGEGNGAAVNVIFDGSKFNDEVIQN